MNLRIDFMKLLNSLPKYLTAFNYGELNLNEIPKDWICNLEFQTFWNKESKGNPSN